MCVYLCVCVFVCVFICACMYCMCVISMFVLVMVVLICLSVHKKVKKQSITLYQVSKIEIYFWHKDYAGARPVWATYNVRGNSKYNIELDYEKKGEGLKGLFEDWRQDSAAFTSGGGN